MYHQNEVADFIDLFAADDIIEEINMIVTKNGLDTRPIAGKLRKLEANNLLDYLMFATKANRSLKMFRMKLRGNFTQVHLRTHGFDFSVEWFTN